ncbi:MAG: DUF3592 domain-containing protein [Chloroflexi bacterium]|nr:DUF3592 domain-containing protein [Chloroflexota bacterium]
MNISEEAKAALITVPISAAFLALGVAIALFGFERFGERQDHRHAKSAWTAVEGVIRSSHLSVFDSENMPDSLDITAEFAYEVDGQRHTSTQEWSQSCSGCKRARETNEERYAAGASAQVFYDPANPSDAALIIPRTGWPLWWLTLAIVGGLIGIFALIPATATYGEWRSAVTRRRQLEQMRRDHPVLLRSITQIIADIDPLDVFDDPDDDIDDTHETSYEWGAVWILVRLDPTSSPGTVAAWLKQLYEDDWTTISEEDLHVTSTKTCDAWQAR